MNTEQIKKIQIESINSAYKHISIARYQLLDLNLFTDAYSKKCLDSAIESLYSFLVHEYENLRDENERK